MSEQAQSAESQESMLGGFDPRVVHERDPITNRIIRTNAHRVLCIDGIRYYEWPKGSRNLWYENREAAGVLDKDGKPKRGASHVDWVAPRSEADDLNDVVAAKDQENKKLAAEMEVIKKELAAHKFEKAQAAQQTANQIKAQAAKKAAVPSGGKA